MAVSLKVDLNCDLGESFGRYTLGEDAEMMKWITSANIACGFHAGDPTVMARTVALAKANGVAVGAHPGYPDLQGFGRRQLELSGEEIGQMICYQLGALEAITRVAGLRLAHVKLHGALYNLAASDSMIARVVSEVVYAFDSALILVGLAGSELTRAGEAVGLRVAQEGFPDRAYLPNGQLMPRSQPGAVITEPGEVAQNVLRLVQEGVPVNGERVRVDTLCLHGDNPNAIRNVLEVRRALERCGTIIAPLCEIVLG